MTSRRLPAAALAAVLAVGGSLSMSAPVAAAPARPFAPDSSWNTPLRSDATYAPVPWPTSTRRNYGVNWAHHAPAVHHSSGADPVVQVRLPADSWGYRAGDYAVRIPRGATGAAGVDGELIVIDGNTVWNFWQFRRTSDTTATVAALGQADARTSSGWGSRTPFRSAGVTSVGASELAGLLVTQDASLPRIEHALQLIVDAPFNVPTPVGEAIHADGQGRAGQAGVALNGGQRLAIPRGVTMPAGLSPLGQKVFVALQTYGAFDVDSSGGMTGLRMQSNAFDAAQVSALNKDMAALIPLLRTVR